MSTLLPWTCSAKNLSDQALIKCQHCPVTVRHKSSLEKHMREVHKGDRPFPCSICGKLFKRRTHLQNHLKTHTGKKPFSCRICKRAFPVKANLTAHLSRHNGMKPHPCLFCKKMFSDKKDRNLHLGVHTKEKPYFCRQCRMTFSSVQGLNVYERVHSKHVKSHVCEFCGKSFAWHCYLHNHKKIHNKSLSNSVKCLFCPNQYPRIMKWSIIWGNIPWSVHSIARSVKKNFGARLRYILMSVGTWNIHVHA